MLARERTLQQDIGPPPNCNHGKTEIRSRLLVFSWPRKIGRKSMPRLRRRSRPPSILPNLVRFQNRRDFWMMSMQARGMRLLRYVDALREAVCQEMERDERVFVFGLDVDD